jgi:putative oxidoreductase
MAPTLGLGLAILRVTLGAIFLMHGYLGLAVIGPAGISGYTTRMGYPPSLGPALAWYLIVAHSVGGLLLILGLWTRWAALAQQPIKVRFSSTTSVRASS